MVSMSNTPAYFSFARLANPSVFLTLSSKISPWLLGAAFFLIAIGLLMGVNAGEDALQGVMVYVMYIHVPFAWLSMMIWTVMTISALGALVWRHPLADVAIKAAAPIGVCFTALALLTGSIWGKPTWGTWWVWDARLTSVLILFIMYLGVIALSRAFDDAAKSGRMVAIFVLVGFINIPIIKFSVNWWNTLHQPASVFRASGPTLDTAFLWPLLVSAVGFSLLFFGLHLLSMQNEIWTRRAISMKRLATHGA